MSTSERIILDRKLDHLAHSLFGPGYGSRLMAFTAFLDGSGQRDTSCVTVAGFVAEVAQWDVLSAQWGRVLDAFEVPYFHSKEVSHFRPPHFDKWKLKPEIRTAFYRSLVNAITSNVRFSVSRTMSNREFRQVNDAFTLEESIGPPYAICGWNFVHEVEEWKIRTGIPEEILYVCESGDYGQGKMVELCRKYLKVEPISRPKESHLQFQAADLAAYENNIVARHFYDELLFLPKHFRKLGTGLFDGLACKDWGEIRYPALDSICRTFKVPTRRSMPNRKRPKRY